MTARGQEQRGGVLLIVLVVLALGSWWALELAHSVRVEQAGSAWLRGRAGATALAEAGIATGRAAFERAAPERLHLSPFAAQGAAGGAAVPGYTTGALRVSIQDETGKFPLNALARLRAQEVREASGLAGVFVRLVRMAAQEAGRPLSPTQARRILGRMRDWVDADDAACMAGGGTGQSEGFETAPGGSGAPNRPLKTLAEALMMPVGPGMTVGDVLPPEKARRLLTVEATGGRINMNTAPREVVMALVTAPERGEAFWQAVEAGRRNARRSVTPGWYLHPRGRGGASYAAVVVRCVDVRARVAVVDAEARCGRVTRRMRMAVRRVGGGPSQAVWSQVWTVQQQGTNAA
ncbi:hypothetical protein [Desulfobaculum sp.]